MGLAYRTVQYPQMEDCASSGKAKDLQIGERYHVTYLNAAGREVLVICARVSLSKFCSKDPASSCSAMCIVHVLAFAR